MPPPNSCENLSSPSNITLSFIVPLFNHVEYSKVMLSNLLETIPKNLTYEIIFVDDNSSDETQSWLNTLKMPNVKKIFNKINLGYSKSNNIGAKESKGEYLVLLNNDLLLNPGWLEPMLEIIELPFLNAGIVGNIQYGMQNNEINHAGFSLNLNGQFIHISEKFNDQDYQKTLAVTGACLLISRINFFKFGLFDENYFNGSEDLDLCFSLFKHGYNIYISHKSVIKHYVSLSRNNIVIQNETNTRYFFNKWRKEIRRELSNKWANALKNNLPEIYEVIDGHLTEPFMSTYNNASLLIGENIVLKHEHRWSKLIDDIDQNSNLSKNLKFEGFRFSHTLNHYLLTDKASVILSSNIKSIVNFYICGRKIDTNNHDSILLSIYVNNIQYKTIELNEISSNVNEGIISPLLLSGAANIFKFQFHYFDVSSKEFRGDASSAIYISHFVIDDKEIKPIN